MDENKTNILYSIKNKLKNDVSDFFIIGSFLSDDWNQKKSDVDIVCVDKSFEEYSYFENEKYIRNILSNLPYKFDIFIYTPKQFNDKITIDLNFHKQILEGASY